MTLQEISQLALLYSDDKQAKFQRLARGINAYVNACSSITTLAREYPSDLAVAKLERWDDSSRSYHDYTNPDNIELIQTPIKTALLQAEVAAEDVSDSIQDLGIPVKMPASPMMWAWPAYTESADYDDPMIPRPVFRYNPRTNILESSLSEPGKFVTCPIMSKDHIQALPGLSSASGANNYFKKLGWEAYPYNRNGINGWQQIDCLPLQTWYSPYGYHVLARVRAVNAPAAQYGNQALFVVSFKDMNPNITLEDIVSKGSPSMVDIKFSDNILLMKRVDYGTAPWGQPYCYEVITNNFRRGSTLPWDHASYDPKPVPYDKSVCTILPIDDPNRHKYILISSTTGYALII